LLRQTRSFKSAGSNNTFDMEYGNMEENAVLQNDISFFFSFSPHYPFIQSYIIFQPTPLYSFTCSDKQAIYDEVQGYPGCGAVRDPSPFSYSPARSYSPTTTPRFTFFARLRRPWLPSAGQGCCCCSCPSSSGSFAFPNSPLPRRHGSIFSALARGRDALRGG